MSINLTEKQYLMLSQFAYLDFIIDTNDFNKNYQGLTLKQVAEKLLTKDPVTGELPNVLLGGGDNNGQMYDSDFRGLLDVISNPNNENYDPVLGQLTFANYKNDNADTGFVGYQFKDTEGNSYFSFTGTEGGAIPPSKDWLDDYYYGSARSIK